MQACDTVLVNGEETRLVDAADRGLQYGDGHFTTLRVSNSQPLLLGFHFDRLERDARCLRIMCPPRDVLAVEVRHLAARVSDGVVKIILTRGAGGRGYRQLAISAPTRVLSCHSLPDYPLQLAHEGVQVRFCSAGLGCNPLLAGVKHLNRLEQVLARAEWDDETVREGLMADSEGFVVEGVMSNLFLCKGGTLMTPLLDRCGVRGVMRTLVMRLAAAEGIPVKERRFTAGEVMEADELFLTNSLIGVWPISRLGERHFPVGPIARKMAKQISEASGLPLCRA